MFVNVQEESRLTGSVPEERGGYMKQQKKLSEVLMIVGMVSLLGILGCGNSAGNAENGCSGYWAKSDDTLTGPANGTLIEPEGWTGGFENYSPLLYTITDSNGQPRNGVCIEFYTDGFWSTSSAYLYDLIGVGPMNRILGITDVSGNIQLFWTSEFLPPSNPIVSTGTSTTAGKDQTGTTWVNAYSGTLTHTFQVDWTVKGMQP
jgi:hypothetical protein